MPTELKLVIRHEQVKVSTKEYNNESVRINFTAKKKKKKSLRQDLTEGAGCKPFSGVYTKLGCCRFVNQLTLHDVWFSVERIYY